MSDEIKEDELIKSNRKFFNYLINLRNRDLRKEIENCNWNAILQLIRYCEYEITTLQREKDRLRTELNTYKNAVYKVRSYINAYSPYFLQTQEENNQTIAKIIHEELDGGDEQ